MVDCNFTAILKAVNTGVNGDFWAGMLTAEYAHQYNRVLLVCKKLRCWELELFQLVESSVSHVLRKSSSFQFLQSVSRTINLIIYLFYHV